MKNIILFFTKLLVKGFGILPFVFLYLLSDLLFWFFRYIIQYRHKVITTNLSKSFPDKTASEIKSISNHFYAYFCDLILEVIKGMSLSKNSLQKRFVYKNPDIFNPQSSCILLGSHYGNWEWGSLSFPLAVPHQVIGIYKPVKNKSVELYLNQLRMKWGLQLTPMRNAGREVIQNRDTPTIYVLIADQTPADIQNAHWLPFLNQDTPFLHGADKLARQTGYPVYHYAVKRLKRGYYEVSFEEICLDPKTKNPGEITRLYAGKLEQMIQDDPTCWLWSHRRWKRKRKHTE